MATHIKTIIGQFNIFWLPQTISVAENIFSRFIAGEDLTTLRQDYEVSQVQLESAIRFFALKWKGNRHARELYNEWQKRRFEVK